MVLTDATCDTSDLLDDVPKLPAVAVGYAHYLAGLVNGPGTPPATSLTVPSPCANMLTSALARAHRRVTRARRYSRLSLYMVSMFVALEALEVVRSLMSHGCSGLATASQITQPHYPARPTAKHKDDMCAWGFVGDSTKAAIFIATQRRGCPRVFARTS